MIAAVFTLDLIEILGSLLGPLRALRSVHLAELLRSDWFFSCAAAALLPLAAVAIVVYLAMHFGG